MLPRRLAQKLIVSLTLIVAIVAGISGVIDARDQERQLVSAMVLGADQLSRGLVSATWQAMLSDHRQAAYEVMQTVALKQGINRIRIFNKEGRVMFSTAQGDTQQVDKKAEACFLCHASQQPLVKVDVPSRARIYRAPDGRRQLAMITPIYNETACSGADCHAHPKEQAVLGVLDLALDFSPVDREVAGIKVRVVLVTGIQILLIALFIAFFTRRFVSRPIAQLMEGTRAVSEMRLDRPIEVTSKDELGELARSFNQMRERLSEALSEIQGLTHTLEAKVTERTEQLRAAHQKLVQSDRLASLGQLAASVAHEINNPLSGVLNLSMLMQRILRDDGIPEGRIPDFRKYLSQVVNETSRVGRIVSDLLAFSRRPKPQRTFADLNGVVGTTVSLLGHKLKLMNVVAHLELSPDLPLLKCDGSQVQQVVMNLVMNAAEAARGKSPGRLTIRTSKGSDGATLRLEVEDNGDGIRAENLPRIFDPFFTTKEDVKGVGLGLAVVYGIIEAHGGDVEVKSQVGEGTLFVVTFPLAWEEKAGAIPLAGPRA